MRTKRFFILVLLLFLTVGINCCSAESTGSAPATNNAPVQESDSDMVVAYYFHGSKRCGPCTVIESYTKEAIDANFQDELNSSKLVFKSVNVEQAENSHFIQDYQLVSRTVVIAKFKDGKQVEWKNLSGVWQNLRNKAGFEKYIKTEIEKYIGEV